MSERDEPMTPQRKRYCLKPVVIEADRARDEPGENFVIWIDGRPLCGLTEMVFMALFKEIEP